MKETVRGFKEIIEGKHDDLPEGAFFMVGTIDERLKSPKDGSRVHSMSKFQFEV